MKTASRKLGLAPLLSCVAVLLSSCGGGGADSSSTPPPPPPPPPGTISFSANAVTFKAAGPYAQSPATQTITGTVTGVTSGTVYVKVVANNAIANSSKGFFTVTNMIITGDSGQATVVPAIPSSIGAGNFQGSITVTTCLNDPSCQTGQLAGSPQTMPVDYDIASGVDGDTVTPRVVAANTAGKVILRGAGFTGATSVGFGSMAATSITVVSDTEIDASYPALPAGTYPVTINSGSISDTASLVAVSPPAFTQTLISYPSGVPLLQNPPAIEYDAQRTVLFALVPVNSQSYTDTLLRYVFGGSAWGSPTQISIANVEQIELSPDGAHLLALVQNDTQASMVELDPVTLAQTEATTVATPYACGFALANDGNAIVSLSPGPGFVFGTFSGIFTPMADPLNCGARASGNGAIVAMGGTTFVASSETVTQSNATGVPGDLAGDKFINGEAVQNQNGQVLGYVSTPFYVMNPAGTRAYGYTADPVTCAPTLSTFDLTATPSGSPQPEFPVLGTPIALPSSCLNSTNWGYSLAISPDGATVFIARPDGVVVQPVPPN